MQKKKIDPLGRIVIPKSVLEELHWENGDEIGFFADKSRGCLTLRKEDPSCLRCGNRSDTVQVKGSVFLCRACLAFLQKIK